MHRACLCRSPPQNLPLPPPTLCSLRPLVFFLVPFVLSLFASPSSERLYLAIPVALLSSFETSRLPFEFSFRRKFSFERRKKISIRLIFLSLQSVVYRYTIFLFALLFFSYEERYVMVQIVFLYEQRLAATQRLRHR